MDFEPIIGRTKNNSRGSADDPALDLQADFDEIARRAVADRAPQCGAADPSAGALVGPTREEQAHGLTRGAGSQGDSMHEGYSAALGE